MLNIDEIKKYNTNNEVKNFKFLCVVIPSKTYTFKYFYINDFTPWMDQNLTLFVRKCY